MKKLLGSLRITQYPWFQFFCVVLFKNSIQLIETMIIRDYLIIFPNERRYNRLNVARKNNTIIWYSELIFEPPLCCPINKDTQNCMWKR